MTYEFIGLLKNFKVEAPDPLSGFILIKKNDPLLYFEFKKYPKHVKVVLPEDFLPLDIGYGLRVAYKIIF